MHRVLPMVLAATACSRGAGPEPAASTTAAHRDERPKENVSAPRGYFALSELAEGPTGERSLDPMSLQEWRVAAPGPDLIEIYAADADPDELIAELLPRNGAWISMASEVDVVSGRLVAPSRSTAIDAIAEAIGTGGRRETLPVGRAPSISVRLVREPLDVVARTISERAGTNVMLAMGRRPRWLSVVARRVAPDVLLKEIAKLVDADVSLTARGWLLHERDGGEIARVAAMGGPLVDVAFDRVAAGEAIALLSIATDVPRRAMRPCGGPEKSGQVSTTRMGLVLAWLVADWPRGRDEPCQLPLWRGNPPILRAELAGIAWYSPTRSAALLRFGNDLAVIRPGQNGTARAVIGPTSIEVRERGRSIFEQSVEPRLKPPQPLYSRLPPIEPDHWRLAATVREGSSWRALLMHTSLEWHWVRERDPAIRRIERDRVVLAPLRAGGPDVELRLARAPQPEL